MYRSLTATAALVHDQPMSDAERDTFRPVIVAPTHRNGRTLPTVLAQLAALDLPAIVVNDGSDDDTAAVLAGWTEATKARFVETHPVNRGKAAALMTGFDCARAHGFTHAVSVDTDLQHDMNDVPSLLALSRQHPASLILGVRPITTAGYPAASRTGR